MTWWSEFWTFGQFVLKVRNTGILAGRGIMDTLDFLDKKLLDQDSDSVSLSESSDEDDDGDSWGEDDDDDNDDEEDEEVTF